MHHKAVTKDKNEGDADGDGNVGVCDVRSSFHLKYDDDDDGRRHKNKNNAAIKI